MYLALGFSSRFRVRLSLRRLHAAMRYPAIVEAACAALRLEARGLVKAEWGLTENNRRARYYTLTPAGRTHLREETARFLRYTETMIGILKAASSGQGS